MSLFLENKITPSEILILSKNKFLIYNEQLSLPYFKIISNDYTLRGSTETNIITLDFNTMDRSQCEIIRSVFCEDCSKQKVCKK